MPGKRWQKWEIDRLKELLGKGLAPSEMTIGSRTDNARKMQAARLGLTGDGISRRPWPASEVKKLRQLLARGVSVPQMVEMLGGLGNHSICAVRTKISRLGLSDPRRSQAIRQSKRMSREQLITFYEFLLVHVRRCTPEQMAMIWNQQYEPKVGSARVVRHLTILGIKLPRTQVLQLPYSVAKRKNRSDKYLASQQKRWKKYRRELEPRLQKMAQQMRAATKANKAVLPHRVCENCRKRWPAVKPFFYVTSKPTRSGRREYIRRVCRTCVNKRKRKPSQLKCQLRYAM